MNILSPELIFPIVPPVCWALYQFFTKLISGNNEPFTAVFYTAVTGALIFTIYISFNWKFFHLPKPEIFMFLVFNFLP